MGWVGGEVPEEACHVEEPYPVEEAISFKRREDHPHPEHFVKYTHILHVYVVYATVQIKERVAWVLDVFLNSIEPSWAKGVGALWKKWGLFGIKLLVGSMG